MLSTTVNGQDNCTDKAIMGSPKKQIRAYMPISTVQVPSDGWISDPGTGPLRVPKCHFVTRLGLFTVPSEPPNLMRAQGIQVQLNPAKLSTGTEQLKPCQDSGS